jgi:cytochrome c
MDLLKTLAIPQSVEHFHVLILIEGLISIVLYPYLGFLLGSSVLSYFLNRMGTRERNHNHTRFAEDLIDIALFSKSVPTFLALLPSFSSVFVFAQLLQSTEAISVSLAAYGFILLLIAVVSLYVYKTTFRLRDVLANYEGLLESKPREASGLEDIQGYAQETVASHFAAGRLGVISLIVASFLLVAALTIATNPATWSDVNSVFALFVSLDVIIRVLQFTALAAGATGVGILYFFFAWEKGRNQLNDEQQAFARRVAVRLITSSFLSLPVFVVTAILLLPPASLSGMVYAFAGVALVLMFLAAQYLYAFMRDSHPRYLNSAVYTLAISFAFLSVNDQVAIHNATATQAVYLAYQYDLATEELKAKLGVAAAALTGEDIYNGRCSACHLFDQKKIGPAYKDVIPKYAGRKDQIIAFVLNPLKKDPAFPPMPNQGLKPAEADSIVSYILKRLGTMDTKPASAGQAAPQK